MADILIAEDDLTCCRMIEQALEPLGHRLHLEHEGHAGVEALSRQPFDLVITDLRLPSGTGFDILEWVVENRKTLPVIVCSGYANAAALRTFFREHRYRVLPKPFKAEDLRAAVAEFLEKASRASA